MVLFTLTDMRKKARETYLKAQEHYKGKTLCPHCGRLVITSEHVCPHIPKQEKVPVTYGTHVLYNTPKPG